MSHIYCSVILGSHEQVDCQDYPLGGSDQLLLLEPDHSITDFSDAAQLLAAIAAGEATLIKGISAEIPEGSPVTEDNPVACGSDTIMVNKDRTILFTDANVTPANVTFYDNLEDKLMGAVLYECEEDRITVIDEDISWVANRNFPTKSLQKFLITGSLRKKTSPRIIEPAPAGIFD